MPFVYILSAVIFELPRKRLTATMNTVWSAMSKILLYIILYVLINHVSVRGEEGRQRKLIEWQIELTTVIQMKMSYQNS